MLLQSRVVKRRARTTVLAAAGLGLFAYAVWPWTPMARKARPLRTIVFYGFSILGEVIILLPALRGGLITGALLTFAHSLGEFGATVMVSGNLRLKTQTAPLYIFAQFEAGDIAHANALAAVLALLSFVIFFFLFRFAYRAEREKAR